MKFMIIFQSKFLKMVVGYNSEVKIMTIEKTKNLRLSSAVFWIRMDPGFFVDPDPGF